MRNEHAKEFNGVIEHWLSKMNLNQWFTSNLVPKNEFSNI